MSVAFFVRDIEEKEPEIHSLEIYIGEQRPEVPEDVTVREFSGKVRLRSFLMAGDWDRVTIYKSPECSQEVVDDLTDWLQLHMSFGSITTLGGGKSGENG